MQKCTLSQRDRSSELWSSGEVPKGAREQTVSDPSLDEFQECDPAVYKWWRDVNSQPHPSTSTAESMQGVNRPEPYVNS
ncbi:hypothetical protein AOLI_G00236300 [Acnodon oligacanthus]